MNPLILQFKEQPEGENLDLSSVRYDELLNLNIDTRTGSPAVSAFGISTETFTKASEGADADKYCENMMMTATDTRVAHEQTDSDPQRHPYFLSTATSTISHGEGSDSDEDVPPELDFPYF